MRSADAMRSCREMADVRRITVGARDARRLAKSVGVRPEREKGVEERGGSDPTAVPGDTDAM